MPFHQLIGLVLIAIGVADTAVGHLLVAPRVPDQTKRSVVKIAFSISGLGIVGVGVALFTGRIQV